MHVKKIEIRNIRSLRSHTWSIPKEKCAGWHVLLGDNGSGKTSFLRAIALALVDPQQAEGLRQSWDDWLRHKSHTGHVRLSIVPGTSGNGDGAPLETGVEFTRAHGNARVKLSGIAAPPPEGVWATEGGWFSASFGPFRRFSGGDTRLEKSFGATNGLARHLSIFDEGVALTECLKWLQDLKFRALENDPEGALLDRVIGFVNQGDFLPAGVQLEEVTSRAVLFRDANRAIVSAGDLSDGYRSILSLTFELIRQMAKACGPGNVFDPHDPTRILPEGVVIIDEVDAHLHPSWQRRIGSWFCDHFPNVQFIVSTHSPFVCQSAARGSVYALPPSGSKDTGGMVRGDALNRLIYGTVLDAYGTEAFGSKAVLSLSNESAGMHQRLAQLNNQEIFKGLSAAEREERRKLRRTLPSGSSATAGNVAG